MLAHPLLIAVGIMLKTLALALALSFSATACTTSDEPDLVFEDDAAKADTVRPYGTFRRELGADEQGLTLLKLNEDRTYEASQELVNCNPGECTDAFDGTYRFASSHGRKYIVLYNNGDWWYAFEYKLDGDRLKLRYADVNEWISMERETPDLQLNDGNDGGTFDVTEGANVVLVLPQTAGNGYSWKVTQTTRTFGYPTETFAPEGPIVGGGGSGLTILTWKTSGPLPMRGAHTVKLEYKRPWDTTTPPADTFSFTVNITAAD